MKERLRVQERQQETGSTDPALRKCSHLEGRGNLKTKESYVYMATSRSPLTREMNSAFMDLYRTVAVQLLLSCDKGQGRNVKMGESLSVTRLGHSQKEQVSIHLQGCAIRTTWRSGRLDHQTVGLRGGARRWPEEASPMQQGNYS